jgi:urea transport system ATP-binding protein
MFEVRNLRSGYGQSVVIDDLSFTVGENETVAVLGRNGMGKSTMFKTLMGVLPGMGGSIKLKNQELQGRESFKRVKAGLGYVPQGRHVFPTLTVEENIKTGLHVRGGSVVPDELYALFPVLQEMRKRKAGNLSGGQQQQLVIARALATNPQLVLLDEPTEGIQPSIIKEIARKINEIKMVKKISFIVTEQVLSFALDVADRIIVMEKGHIALEAPRSDVDEQTISKYLSV